MPETFKVVSKCPMCSHKYEHPDVRLLQEQIDSHLIYIKCEKCKSSVLALVMMQAFGAVSYGLITDLNEEEIFKFKNSAIIKEDDMLDMFNFLKKVKTFKDLSL